MQLRRFVIQWFERNRELGEMVIRRSFGRAIHTVLNKIKSNYCWTDYTTILLCALAFEIDICVLSPCDGLNMLVSNICQHYQIQPPLHRGQVTLLFHEYGVDPNFSQQTANHFSLLTFPNSFASLGDLFVPARSPSAAPELAPILVLDEDPTDVNPALRDSSPVDSAAANAHPIGPKLSEGLNIFCWNATSLKADNRILQLREIAKESAVDIFLVEECGLQEAPYFENFNAEIAFANIRPRGILGPNSHGN
jgi:hypothetical protein